MAAYSRKKLIELSRMVLRCRDVVRYSPCAAIGFVVICQKMCEVYREIGI